MIIHNTTFSIDKSIVDDVLAWIKKSYAPSAIRLGANPSYLLTRILTHADDGAESYALQLTFPDLSAAQRWNEGPGQKLIDLMHGRWGEKALTFNTLMEVLE